MEQLFKSLTESIFSELQSGEELVANFHGEESLFIRFNKSKVRQVSDILQMSLSLTLKRDKRETTTTISVSNDPGTDKAHCEDCLKDLRARLSTLEQQPFFVEVTNNGTSHAVHEGTLLASDEYLEVITSETSDVDLAGILTSGDIAVGNANSKGQYHWFKSTSFCFDYSLYTAKEKAVKASYSGTKFIREDFTETLREAKKNLSYMATPNKVLPPGKYRCYLAPAAVNEILTIYNWGGTSQSALKRGNSPLLPIEDEGKELSEKFTLKEDFSLGLHPSFNAEGEVSPKLLNIFKNGKLENLLTSTKTAKEFDLKSTNANDGEQLQSAVIATGNLKREDILKELNNGIYISNLHYLNWSDNKKGRITGMTRFACFAVENGEIIGPIKDLRFDETIFNIWGKNLLSVTDFAETAVDTDTYFKRNPGGKQCPGMLVKDFNFTL
jgi:predicted Zn-dependent protease